MVQLDISKGRRAWNTWERRGRSVANREHRRARMLQGELVGGRESREKRLADSAEIEETEGELGSFSWVVAVEKPSSFNKGVEKTKENHYSSMISLQFSQERLDSVEKKAKREERITWELTGSDRSRKTGQRVTKENALRSDKTLAVRDLYARMHLWLCMDCVQSGTKSTENRIHLSCALTRKA